MQKGTLIGTDQRLGHFAYLLEESAFNPILHTTWLDNHLKSNSAKYYFYEKS
jgi:hypothetical protein